MPKVGTSMKPGCWRLSNAVITVLAVIDSNGIILESAPVTNRFVTQPISNLVGWMKNKVGLK